MEYRVLLLLLRIVVVVVKISLLQRCDTYTIVVQHQSLSLYRQPIHTILSMKVSTNDNISTRATKTPTIISSQNTNNHDDKMIHRRYFLSFLSLSIPITTGNLLQLDNVNAIVAIDTDNNISENIIDNENTSTTTQLFNADGSLKDTNQVIVAQERTIQLVSNNNDKNKPIQVWIDGKSSNSRFNTNQDSVTTSKNINIQYNLPQKWDNNYIDSTTKERACTQISVYHIPYSKVSNENNINDNSRKSSSRQRTTNIQLSDIINILPNDSTIYQSLRDGDLISGNVRQSKLNNNNDNDDTSNTTKSYYYEYDVAIAPKTCSGTENEDLRLGFCPYESIYLLSAYMNHHHDDDTVITTTSDNNIDNDNLQDNSFITLLIIESTRSEWKRANADLRRIRSSFNVQ